MSLLEEVKFIGNNLVRPECVLVDKNETLHIADWRGGVTLITKNGDQQTILARGNFQPKPNGIAIHPNGGWLLTHLGDDIGGVSRLYNNGELVPFLLEIDNELATYKLCSYRSFWKNLDYSKYKANSTDFRM